MQQGLVECLLECTALGQVCTNPVLQCCIKTLYSTVGLWVVKSGSDVLDTPAGKKVRELRRCHLRAIICCYGPRHAPAGKEAIQYPNHDVRRHRPHWHNLRPLRVEVVNDHQEALVVGNTMAMDFPTDVQLYMFPGT